MHCVYDSCNHCRDVGEVCFHSQLCAVVAFQRQHGAHSAAHAQRFTFRCADSGIRCIAAALVRPCQSVL